MSTHLTRAMLLQAPHDFEAVCRDGVIATRVPRGWRRPDHTGTLTSGELVGRWGPITRPSSEPRPAPQAVLHREVDPDGEVAFQLRHPNGGAVVTPMTRARAQQLGYDVPGPDIREQLNSQFGHLSVGNRKGLIDSLLDHFEVVPKETP